MADAGVAAAANEDVAASSEEATEGVDEGVDGSAGEGADPAVDGADTVDAIEIRFTSICLPR